MMGEYGEDGGEGGFHDGFRSDNVDDSEDDPLPPPPPDREEDKELLFLIEFLVDTLRTRPDAFDGEHLDPCVLQGQNCVHLTFLHFPPMSICEKDLDSDKIVGDKVTTFNSGKSLVFALTEAQFEEPPPVFLEVTAFKDLPHGFPIPRIQFGRTKIDLSELFHMVFDKYDEKPNELPVAKSIKDNYVMTANGKVTADIDIYIRLTCLGQNIVTEFQKSDGACDPFLFKNLQSEKVYECRQTKEKDDTVPVPNASDRKCGAKRPQVPVYDPADEDYEEIYAEINGSAITVTVEKSRRRNRGKIYKLEDFCDCDIPLPPDLVEGISQLSVTPVVTGVTELPDGAVGKCDNKIVFQVPPCEKLAQPDGMNAVSYRVNTCDRMTEHGHKGPSYKIVTDDDVTHPTLPNDPDRDAFYLKIVKRGHGQGGKGTVNLEFKTPKSKIEAPKRPPYMLHVGVGPDKQKEKPKKR